AKATPLGAKQMTIVEGSLDHRAAVDVSVPAAPPASKVSQALNFGAGFTLGTIETLGDTLQNTVIAARDAFSGYVTDPKLLLPSFEIVYATAGLLTQYWQLLTFDEKQALQTRIASILALAADDAYKSLIK